MGFSNRVVVPRRLIRTCWHCDRCWWCIIPLNPPEQTGVEVYGTSETR